LVRPQLSPVLWQMMTLLLPSVTAPFRAKARPVRLVTDVQRGYLTFLPKRNAGAGLFSDSRVLEMHDRLSFEPDGYCGRYTAPPLIFIVVMGRRP
jgi:hypothetical protein